MVKGIQKYLTIIRNLTDEKEKLQRELNDTKDIINAIKKGHIDIVISENSVTQKILVSANADPTYRKFIESMTEGVVAIHANGVIIYSNSSFAKIFDLPLENVIGSNLRKYIPPSHKWIFERFFTKYPAKNKKIELSIINARGKKRHFVVSFNKLNLQYLAALNLVWTDVTAQKIIEEKLVRVNLHLENAIAERRLSENKVVTLNSRLKKNIGILETTNEELAAFAYIASHDLQEPVRKTMIYSGLLLSDYYEQLDTQGKHYLNVLQSASEKMITLIRDILKFSELSKNKLLFQPTNIQLIFQEILSNLEFVIKDSKAVITITKELPIIEANASQMLQLFQNLLSNSLKFSKAGIVPKIKISYRIVKGKQLPKIPKDKLNDKFCIFYIRDNGIGFEDLYMKKIFIAFRKLNNNSKYSGSGIGLAICKKIMDHHNGSISGKGKLNRGSLFTIVLPVQQSDSQAALEK